MEILCLKITLNIKIHKNVIFSLIFGFRNTVFVLFSIYIISLIYENKDIRK